MNTAASSDEKVLAALAHGSVFMMFLGPVVPVILWASQRKKSKYVSFHALQAMGYQALYFWLGIVVAILIMMLFICLIPVLSISLQNSGEPTLIPFLVQVPIMLSLFGYLGLFFILGIVGAVSCFLGRDFRYPVLGRWLERYLSYDADSETQIMEAHEDNWVAAICHATAILQLWGVVTPLIVWFSQKERSTRLRFQAMQAFLYQLLAFAAYFLGMAGYMAAFLGMFLTMILGGNQGGSSDVPGPPAFMMIFLVVMLVFWLIIFIVMPIYYLLAWVAGYRVIRGHHFRYPILGKMIEERVKISQRLEPVS